MFPTQNRRSVVAIIFLMVAVFAAIPATTRAAAYGVNLLVNGNAEAGPASPNGTSVPVAGWTTSDGFTVVAYGTNEYPTVSQGPPDAMNQLFAGGNPEVSTATQDIDVSDKAADIDGGEVVCDFSAWLGGKDDQGDNAVMTVAFNAPDGTVLGSRTIGPVTAADRTSQTKLLFRFRSVAVPKDTRSIRASLVMQRVEVDSSNDGYADSLSVSLRGPAVVTNTADSGAGSLRDVIAKGSVVTFDPVSFGESKGPQTITLQSALPGIRGIQSIIGPGAKLLTVRRDSAGTSKFRIFTVGGTAGTDSSLVYISGLTISDGDVSKTASGTAGAISVSYSYLTLQACLVTGNKADSFGALWAFNASVVLDGCTVSSNSASDVGAIGSEAGNDGKSALVLNNCTITGNSTTDTTLTPEVLRNRSDTFGSTATMSVSSSTISGNTGGFRQVTAGDLTKAVLHLENSIIASTGANFPPGGAGATYVSHGFNLSNQNDVFVLNKNGDRNNTDPMLGALEDNGGSTPTQELLPGSPAIDKGNTSLTTDQRGFPRPIDDPGSVNSDGNAADIGAYEFSPTAIANISTRARVETGDHVLIAGFILTGTQDKKVIVRAIGPSLSVAGRLDDPTLELRDSSGALLSSNDNWISSPNKQAIMDSTLAPTNDLESAIVVTLPANGSSYTAILRGVGGGTGLGVVEVYDLDASTDSRLANISTRGFVSTGDDVLIAGTILVGPAPQQLIIRAIGPSLSVSGKLADPTLELRDANGALIDYNDNWQDSPDNQTISDSTIPPSDPLEAAIVATLSAGGSNYTAIVRGAGNDSNAEALPASVSRVQEGTGTTAEIQRVQFGRTPIRGTFKLTFTRPHLIVSGQPGDKAALEDTTRDIPWNATADEIKDAILASSKFYKYDQNNNLTAGPKDFHTLFDSGGGLGITGNEGFRREPIITRSATNFTIQFGTPTEGSLGTHNTWVTTLPLVQVDDSAIVYEETGIALVEIYALH